MKAACAFFLSAKALNALTPRDPRAGTARGTPAFGSEVALTVDSVALASFVLDAADALAALLPAPAEAAALPFPAAAAELEDEDELPLELDEPEEAAAPSPAATATDEPVDEELELPSPEDEEAPLEPLDPAAPPPDTTATDELVVELELVEAAYAPVALNTSARIVYANTFIMFPLFIIRFGVST